MNMKAECLLSAAALLPKGSVIVEIGCIRRVEEVASDGWSTVYLAQAAAENGWMFHSVDSDEGAVRIARELTAGTGAKVHHADGESWLLMSCPADIDLLYLDGAASPGEAVDQYHAAPLAVHSTVVIDDIQPINEHARGKGNLLLDQLVTDGFTIITHDTEPGYRMAVATQ